MTSTSCPTCSGLSLPSHPGGWLGGWQHAASCLTRTLEDARQAADFEGVRRWGRFTRSATSAELLLLAALGFSPPAGLVTAVVAVTAAVVNRSWPALAGATPATPAARPASRTAPDRWGEFRDLEGQPATVTVRDPHGELPSVDATSTEHGFLVLPPPPETEADA